MSSVKQPLGAVSRLAVPQVQSFFKFMRDKALNHSDSSCCETCSFSGCQLSSVFRQLFQKPINKQYCVETITTTPSVVNEKNTSVSQNVSKFNALHLK